MYFVILLDDILKELVGVKAEIAKQDPQTQTERAAFRKTLDVIAERTLSMQTELQCMHAKVRLVHVQVTNMGAATQAAVVSNVALGKAVADLQNSFVSISDDTGKLLKMRVEDVEAIKTMKSSIDMMKERFPEVIAPMEKKLEELLKNVHDLPTLALIFPHVPKTPLGKMNPMQLFQSELNLQFMCEFSYQLSCKVYKITSTKEWVSC